MVQCDLAKDSAEWVFDKYEQYKHDTSPQRREQTATMSGLLGSEIGRGVARVYDSAQETSQTAWRVGTSNMLEKDEKNTCSHTGAVASQ